MDDTKIFLLLNLALAFYNTGTIWAIEVDIFRTWKIAGRPEFHRIQSTHWKKLPYWIFTPVGLALLGSVAMIWYHPAGSPLWAIYGNLAFQLISHILTAIFWGQWQAKLSKDELGPNSPYLDRILKTHWIRTLLINAYAFTLLAWAIIVLR
jgi:hypothetical protein